MTSKSPEGMTSVGEESSGGTELEFQDTVSIASTKDTLWPRLAEAEFLAACIPGAEHVERRSEHRYAVRVRRGVNRLSISLDGDVEIVDMHEADWILIEGNAYDSRTHSEFEGVAAMELARAGDHTVDLSYRAILTFSGGTSILTPGVLRTIVESDVDRFFRNIAEMVEDRS